MNWYFYNFLGENPFSIGGIDVKSYYKGMSGCQWSETQSSRIPDKYKGTAKHTHNAPDDAIEQGKMFELMIAYNKNTHQNNGMDAPALHGISSVPESKSLSRLHREERQRGILQQ